MGECTVFGRHVGLSLPIQEEAVKPAGVTSHVHGGGNHLSTPSPANSLADAKPKITYQDLAQHKTRAQRTWVGLYGNIYDLTDYIDEHPGGAEAITDVAGIDGTEHFAAVHNRELLDSMGFEPIGILAK